MHQFYNLLIITGCIARTTYVYVAYCYRLSSMVCRSVTLVSPAKSAVLSNITSGLRTQVAQVTTYYMGVQIPPW